MERAAGVRFELTSPCGLAVFKTAPFDRSGTPPHAPFKPIYGYYEPSVRGAPYAHSGCGTETAPPSS